LKGLSLKELEDEIPTVKRGRDKKSLSSDLMILLTGNASKVLLLNYDAPTGIACVTSPLTIL